MGWSVFELNREPLDAYASATSSQQLVDLQFDFFDIERPTESDEP